jgi:hypothetical protein
MPLSLSDSELCIVMDAAAPIRTRDRDSFLRDVAAALEKYPEIGPGIIGQRRRQAAAPVSGSAHRPQRRKYVRAWTLPPNYSRSVGDGVVVDHGGPYVIPSPKANAPVEQVPLNPADIEGLQGFEENSVGIGARRRFRMGIVDRDQVAQVVMNDARAAPACPNR